MAHRSQLSRRHRHRKRRTIYGTPSRFNQRRRRERVPTSWNGGFGHWRSPPISRNSRGGKPSTYPSRTTPSHHAWAARCADRCPRAPAPQHHVSQCRGATRVVDVMPIIHVVPPRSRDPALLDVRKVQDRDERPAVRVGRCACVDLRARLRPCYPRPHAQLRGGEGTERHDPLLGMRSACERKSARGGGLARTRRERRRTDRSLTDRPRIHSRPHGVPAHS